jgi:hypothetical protein
MITWQYFYLNIQDLGSQESQDILNHHGAQGWEIVTAFKTPSGVYQIMFKRPQESVPATPQPKTVKAERMPKASKPKAKSAKDKIKRKPGRPRKEATQCP